MGIIANTSSLGIIEEVTAGSIPSNPTFQQLPVNSINFTEGLITKSKKYLGERIATGHFIISNEISGSIGFDFTYNNWKDYLIDLLRCNETQYHNVSINSTLIGVSSGYFTAYGGLYFDVQGIEDGMYINVSGFNNSENNGVFRVDHLFPGGTSMQVTGIKGGSLVDETIGKSIVMEADDFTNDAEDGKTYTLRNYYKRDDGTPVYQYYRGCKISRFILSIRTGELIQGLLEFKGIDKITSQQAGESLIEYTPDPLMGALNEVKHLYLYGLSPERVFTEFDLVIDNLSKWRRSADNASPNSVVDSDFSVEVNAIAYHEDLDVNDLWLSNGDISFGLMLNDGSNAIGININKLQVREDTMPVRGKNAFVFEPMQLDSVKDENEKLIYFNFI